MARGRPRLTDEQKAANRLARAVAKAAGAEPMTAAGKPPKKRGPKPGTPKPGRAPLTDEQRADILLGRETALMAADGAGLPGLPDTVPGKSTHAGVAVTGYLNRLAAGVLADVDTLAADAAAPVAARLAANLWLLALDGKMSAVHLIYDRTVGKPVERHQPGATEEIHIKRMIVEGMPEAPPISSNPDVLALPGLQELELDVKTPQTAEPSSAASDGPCTKSASTRGTLDVPHSDGGNGKMRRRKRPL